MARGYKVRSAGENGFALAVPADIATVIPDDVRFQPEITDEGILYRAYRGDVPVQARKLPNWAKPFEFKVP